MPIVVPHSPYLWAIGPILSFPLAHPHQKKKKRKKVKADNYARPSAS